jgi:hypothetical protein
MSPFCSQVNNRRPSRPKRVRLAESAPLPICRVGIVNLSQRRAEEGRFSESGGSSSGAGLGDLAPDRKDSRARSATKISGDGFGIGNVEEVGALIMNRQKPLCLSR